MLQPLGTPSEKRCPRGVPLVREQEHHSYLHGAEDNHVLSPRFVPQSP